MCTITATEFKTNFGKYAKMAQKESIQVTSHGKIIFEINPPRESLIRKAESLIGCLPDNVPFDLWKDRY